MMKMRFSQYLAILLLAVLTGCGHVPPATPTPLPTIDNDEFTRSNGGGEPRSASYWLLWNSCAPDNRAATAAANGGRTAGWIILDDLLADPGLWVGELQIETCLQGTNLLNKLDLEGVNRGEDAAYQLAQGLLVAQLNLDVGAEACPAVDEAVLASHLLLASLGFTGYGGYLDAPQADTEGDTAAILVERLENYNLGELCR